MAQWIVVLEVSGDAGFREVAAAEIEDALTEAVSHVRPVGGGFAVELELPAESPAGALFSAASRCREALRLLSGADWDVRRAEVFSAATDREGELVDADDLLHEAFHDSLTGLAKRGLFLDRVGRALVRSAEWGSTHAVLLIDLDGFREANVRLGAAGGDALLIAMARRLTAALSIGETAARVGGDQFAVLVEHCSEDQAVAIVTRLLDAMRHPFLIHASSISVTGTVGIAMSRPGHDAEQLLREAGAAMCLAKQTQRGGWEWFRPGMPEPDSVRLERGADLRLDRLSCLLLLQRAAMAANESDSFAQAVRVVLQQVCALTGWSVGHLYVIAGAGGALLSTDVWHLVAPERCRPFQEATAAMSLAEPTGLARLVFETGGPVWVRDIAGDESFVRAKAAAAAGLQAALAVPVIAGKEVVAVLEFFGHESAEPSGSLLQVLAAVGEQIGRVVERERDAAELRRYREAAS